MVLLQVSELSKQSVESRHEHPGCPGSSATFKQYWSMGHASNVGALKLHSQVDGFVVMLQVSAFSKQCETSKQEHEGCSGCCVSLFTHFLPASHGRNDGKL